MVAAVGDGGDQQGGSEPQAGGAQVGAQQNGSYQSRQHVGHLKHTHAHTFIYIYIQTANIYTHTTVNTHSTDPTHMAVYTLKSYITHRVRQVQPSPYGYIKTQRLHYQLKPQRHEHTHTS